MRYDTVLLDADGTLLDFARVEKEALSHTLKEAQIEADEKMISKYSAINDALWKSLEIGEIEKSVLKYRRFEILFERYGISADAHAINNAFTDYMCKKVYLIDGARELCEKLYGKAKLYIVTNGTAFVQEAKFSLCGLKDFFEDMFISDIIGCEKPSAKFFEYVEGHIPNFKKEKTIIVGDSLTSDMRGGINYGIDTCWYAPAITKVPEDMIGKITFIARDLSQVFDFITQGEKI